MKCSKCKKTIGKKHFLIDTVVRTKDGTFYHEVCWDKIRYEIVLTPKEKKRIKENIIKQMKDD